MKEWKQRTGYYNGKTQAEIDQDERMTELARAQYVEATQAIVTKARQDRMRATYTRYDENGEVIDE
ncbi:hypothetical protein C7446_2517 [Kushneria sinocarnis]|uniref:Uncharacterized protein n=1 Tax=Kushneria sinocarnis TaxID=595502 RepID=A0A420WUH7_9GAMM|nr:hypothetical protein [Kushneria sinocarnis]RKQ97098.1 hypothetical protein C7446_2517 [Kushneria sinocarnis]